MGGQIVSGFVMVIETVMDIHVPDTATACCGLSVTSWAVVPTGETQDAISKSKESHIGQVREESVKRDPEEILVMNTTMGGQIVSSFVIGK